MTINISILYSALLACILNLVLTPLILWLSHRNKWYDHSNARKIHSGDIPRLGGIGLFWSFIATMAGASALFLGGAWMPWSAAVAPVFAALLMIHELGLIDDFRSLRALLKLVVQIAAAVLVVSFGFTFKVLYLPFAPFQFDLGWFAYPLTVLWIVGITNALNLIDGMDGLAGGLSVIAACVSGIIYIATGQLFAAMACFALLGSIAGFLFYNFPPARIFMGDSGSLFLGFALAVIPLLDKGEGPRPIGLWSAVTILLIPMLDTFAAMIRRRKNGVSFFTPDKYHLHHKLLDMGLSVRQILGTVYAAAMFLGAIAIGSIYLDRSVHFWLCAGSWVAFVALFSALHFIKERLLREKSAGPGEPPSGR